jgi:hypothetical protein
MSPMAEVGVPSSSASHSLVAERTKRFFKVRSAMEIGSKSMLPNRQLFFIFFADEEKKRKRKKKEKE